MSKKIVSLIITISICVSMCLGSVYAAPQYIVAGGKAYDLMTAAESQAYKTAMKQAITGSDAYLADDTANKTVDLMDLALLTGTYAQKIAAAEGVANLGAIALVNEDLTTGPIVALPGSGDGGELIVLEIE